MEIPDKYQINKWSRQRQGHRERESEREREDSDTATETKGLFNIKSSILDRECDKEREREIQSDRER